jgi:hypothetical protein
MAGVPDVCRDNWKGITADRTFQSQTPFPAPRVKTQSADEAFGLVLKNAGASVPKRDPIDTRIVSEVRDGTGKIIDNEKEVGGWPVYAFARSEAITGEDGIPIEWKAAHSEHIDANTVNADGYTELEVYLNSLVGPGD